ncbi:uncharacterized protein G2W53_014119 [Senna tora]|uniref:Uncharacterized protein n=1 Tax=Senna tora TaxID=362788 RepID=A0A834WSW6_9FABA|nr:uncharacterized protein G2W53_014119 [Senna tora]
MKVVGREAPPLCTIAGSAHSMKGVAFQFSHGFGKRGNIGFATVHTVATFHFAMVITVVKS